MKYAQILCCPSCRGTLTKQARSLYCSGCRTTYPVRNGIAVFVKDSSNDRIFREKWDTYYRHGFHIHPNDNLQEITARHIEDALQEIERVKNIQNKVFMEIGCGTFALGARLARSAKLVIGIDFSAVALKLAKKRLDRLKITNYLLMQGDIQMMPINSGLLDIVYGGGVIEHLRDTRPCISEMHRVLKKEGVAVNSVPMLNIGSLTYRQLWGNIPNAPVLRQMAEFIHMRLLGARHMTYGFELSFLPRTLITLHKNAKFRTVLVDKYSVQLVFEFAPKFLRPLLIRLANSSPLFWPMVKVVAVK